MGQKLQEWQREMLKRHPAVQYVTREHLILQDGTVPDPSEFPLIRMTLYLIQKLIRCRCPGLIHEAGYHELVPVFGGQTILGNTVIEIPAEPLYCPNGVWVTEETLTEEQAKPFRLLIESEKKLIPQ